MQTNFAPRLIISALFFVVVAAQGQEPLFNQRNATGDPHVCSLKASVFEAAATARDNNGTQALARQMAAAYKEVSSSYREVGS